MKHILLVDDEPHVIRVMRLSLEKAGYRIGEAANGLQAMEYLQKYRPDLMITDIDMPRMNGRELCEEITRTMPDRTFRILVLTARAEDEHRAWSSGLDNIGFFEKPVSMRRLLAALDEYFNVAINDGGQACQSAR
ncbi:MAG: response regulator [Thiohalobacterales bacterium]|nr:response regulator [Thiohalobacterales bacterium]